MPTTQTFMACIFCCCAVLQDPNLVSKVKKMHYNFWKIVIIQHCIWTEDCLPGTANQSLRISLGCNPLVMPICGQRHDRNCASFGGYMLMTVLLMWRCFRAMGRCRKCMALDNIARAREDLAYYKYLLENLRVRETKHDDNAKVAFLLQVRLLCSSYEKGMKLLHTAFPYRNQVQINSVVCASCRSLT